MNKRSESFPRMVTGWKGTAVLATVLCLAVGGCRTVAEPDDAYPPYPGPSQVLILLGHSGSPKDDVYVRIDGSREPLWVDSPEESAARAVHVVLKGTEEHPVQPGEFTLVRWLQKTERRGERILLERSPDKDVIGRRLQVWLFRREDLWVAEAVLVNQEVPQHLKKDF